MARPKAPGVADIERDFAPAAPDEETAQLHAQVNDIVRKAALALNKVLPVGRHRSMAITHLEEAMWCANSAVAHDRDRPGVLTQIFGEGGNGGLPIEKYKTAREKKLQADQEETPAAKAPRKVAAKKTVAKAEEIFPPEPKATVTPIKRVARRASRP